MADGSAPALVRSACPYCGTGCGLTLAAGEGRGLVVAPDPAHPANRGLICSKGAALGATVGLKGRLLHPVVGDRRTSWDEAVATVARRFNEAIARHGPDSVAFYVSGQLLTEDYYAANKLMKGFIGSGNIDTNSRLCMASAVAAHVLAFGEDLVPGCYEDVDLAELVVFAGHNAAFTHPVLFRRAEQARARGQKHVVIDPRRTDTAEGADLHLPIAPQTDVRLWNGLLADLVRRGAVDRAFTDAHVAGLQEVLEALGRDDQSASAVAADCGLELGRLKRFYDLFAACPRTVSLFCMGVNQSAQGVNKALSIINAHLLTGRIGKPGACPFSMTGQPNAMGGREVGGMANTLAAHMDFDPASRARVQRFWGSPRMAAGPGLKAVELFEAMEAGRIKAVWIMATNPAVSLPDSARVRRALARCPFVVVSDCMDGADTMAFAQVRLPALAWGEKDGTVTNSERCISRQRAALAAPGEARPDWRVIADVATAMGHDEAFGWRAPWAVFREWARLTAYENDGGRVLDLSGLSALSPEAYEALEPVQWGGTRLFADGRFPTPDGRARMLPVRPEPAAEPADGAFPLALNTGRVRDQWHTMTRTGLAPELCRHAPEPFVEVHPEDAEAFGVRDGALTRVITRQGVAVVEARVTARQRRGALFMPMHWTDAFAPSGRANAITSARRDPRSGQPEYKHAPARIRGYGETWRGLLLAREDWACPSGLDLVWRRTPLAGCMLHRFAGRGDEHERAALRKAVARTGPSGEVVALEDPSGGSSREAWLSGGRLDRVLFMTVSGRLPAVDWLAPLFGEPALEPQARAWLLAGRPPGPAAPEGPLVCACLGVGSGRIDRALAHGARTLEEVGCATGAGTNCGSCRPEIARMLKAAAPAPAARKETADVV
jgi:assimilatory nitrate reductase catalytic subunit